MQRVNITSLQYVIRLQMQLYQGEIDRSKQAGKCKHMAVTKRMSNYNWNLANRSSFSDRLMISLSPDAKIRISLPSVASSLTNIITNSS